MIGEGIGVSEMEELVPECQSLTLVICVELFIHCLVPHHSSFIMSSVEF